MGSKATGIKTTAVAVSGIPEKERGAIATTVTTLTKQAAACKINDQKSREGASALLSMIKQKQKKVMEFRDSRIKPIKESIKLLEADFKQYLNPLTEAEQKVKDEIARDYQHQQALQRVEQERIAREEAERIAKLQKQMDKAKSELAKAEAEALMQETMIEAERQKAAAEAQSSIKTSMGSSNVRMMWTFEIIDEAKVPKDYCEVSSVKVNAAIKLGKRDIPGLRIYEKPVISGRS